MNLKASKMKSMVILISTKNTFQDCFFRVVNFLENAMKHGSEFTTGNDSTAFFPPLSYLQYDFLHLFVGRLELSLQDEHHFPGVVVGILSVHERDQITNGLQEGSQTLRNTIYKTQIIFVFSYSCTKYAQVCEFKMFLIANKKFDCESYQIYEQYYTDAYNI